MDKWQEIERLHTMCVTISCSHCQAHFLSTLQPASYKQIIFSVLTNMCRVTNQNLLLLHAGNLGYIIWFDIYSSYSSDTNKLLFPICHHVKLHRHRVKVKVLWGVLYSIDSLEVRHPGVLIWRKNGAVVYSRLYTWPFFTHNKNNKEIAMLMK